MKIKGFIISGVILAVIGGGAMAYSTRISDFDFDKLKFNVTMEEQAYTITDEITSLEYNGVAEKLFVYKSETSEAKIEGYKSDYMDFSYSIENGKLTIDQKYEDKWYDFFFKFNGWNYKAPEFKVYLPEKEYDLIDLDISASSLELNDLNTKALKLNCTAGNITINSSSIGTLDASIKAGNLEISDSKASIADLKITAGNIDFVGDITAKGIFSTTAGNIEISLPQSSGFYKVNGAGEGNVEIYTNSTAGHININYKEN